MRSKAKPVLGVIAPAPKPTLAGAFWLASILSVPVFVLLSLVEIVWRLWGG